MPSLRPIVLPAGIVLLLAVVALYWAGLNGNFFFDDEANILAAEGLRMEEISLQSIRDAVTAGGAGPTGRPIAQLSFALNHYLNGFDPFAFKLGNLAIHLVTGLLIFFTASRLCATPTIAGIATAFWLVNPIQLTPVLYVVQRMTSLSALFVFAGLLLHITGRQAGGRKAMICLPLAWCVLWPLGCLSKENGLLFPLFVLCWELLIWRITINRFDRFACLLSTGIGICAVAAFTYAFLPAGHWLLAGYEMRNFSLVERVLTEGRILWVYLGLMAFPRLEAFALHHDDIPLSTGLFEPWTTFPAWLGLLALVWFAWRSRNRAPLMSFGIAWFLIGHSLESTVLPLEIAHEHRNYLPSFGIALIAASAIGRLARNSGWQRTLGIALATGFIGYCALVTALRADQYGDEIRRTQVESQHHPMSARTHFEAGRTLLSRLEIASADSPQYFLTRSHFEKAGKLDTDFKLSLLGLMQLNCQVGKPADVAWIDDLAHRLNASPFGPGDRVVLFGIKEMSIAGSLCLSRSEIERLFSAAIANPTVPPHVDAILNSWLADYLTLAVGDLSAAQTSLDKSLDVAPYNFSNRLKRAQLAYLQGRRDDARDLLERIPHAKLTKSERETRALLLDCMASGDDLKCQRR